ncbi:DUF6134 family protein [Roseomonas sp. OT10]|uniref:DUF6134 family protein n=1 Tax=Roseomonas cutis TaxID=2897332 RepID=UPI001E2E3CFB|nr:DUF6134 family protein [Roseomonas sp. OT10]UFN47059.1 DUF6134 family protein [Roseomonas sp. OT10]
MARPTGTGAPALPRRALLASPLLAAPLLLVPARLRAAPPAGGYRWRIIRDGSPVGTHRVSFSRQGPVLSARTEIAILIRLMGFTVFRYRHDYTETWEGERLTGFRSLSERQGLVVQSSLRAQGDGLLAIQGDGREARLPRDAAPLSWWDQATLTRPLFDTTTGQPAEARPVRAGRVWRQATAPFAEAGYDEAGRWVSYAAKGDDGTPVRYEPETG